MSSERAFDEWVESVKQGPASEWDNHRVVFNAGYQAGRKSLTLLLENIIAYWNCGEVEKLKELEEQNEERLDLLREVSYSGVESDLKGIDYLTVQVDRKLWNAIRKELEK